MCEVTRSLRTNPLKFKTSRKNADHLKGVYRIFLESVKKKPKYHNMEPLGLWNTRHLTDYIYAQKSSPDTLTKKNEAILIKQQPEIRF